MRPYKKSYTWPQARDHNGDLTKKWYVSFTYKCEGNSYRFTRSEGINRIMDLEERTAALARLLADIKFDLKNGWNPLEDEHRDFDYNPFLATTNPYQKSKQESKPKQIPTTAKGLKTKEDYYNYLFNK
jgi:hypothetical protein